MKRHKGLHELSRHHHFALMESLFIRRARQQSAARRTAALRRVAQKFLRFWERNGRVHFREEEEILLPAFARHVPLESDPDVVRMLAEHALIRGHVERLGELVKENAPVEEELERLGRLLNDHVRLEENRIFPRIEKTLSEAELQSLGKRLTRLHGKGACDI